MYQVRPIRDEDVTRVAGFMAATLNPRPGIPGWEAVMRPPWGNTGPNHGFLLEKQGAIVGAYLAVYSEGKCNLAAFSVLPDFRSHTLALCRALIRQPGYTFTDLSPSGNVVALNERLGFRHLDTASSLVPNIPRPARSEIRVTADHSKIGKRLSGSDSRIFHDHAGAAAAQHLLAYNTDSYAHLVYRRDRRRQLPLFASPLHVGGDRVLLEQAWPVVATRLFREGLPFTLAEHRILGFRPRLGLKLAKPRPKMVRGAEDGNLDYLYSELALLQW